MIPLTYVLLAVATSGAPITAAAPDDVGDRVTFAQMTIQQRIIIRVPARPPVEPVTRPVEWKEAKGPRCLSMSTLSGAAITQRDSVDLFVRGGARYRAQLDDECPALDYYSGFYLSPTKDGQICSGRDSIRTRAGGECGIDRFRTLVPRR